MRAQQQSRREGCVGGAGLGDGGAPAAPVHLQRRETGLRPGLTQAALCRAAEDCLVNKRHLQERFCEVPGVPRSTFLMVFSPDGTKVASTHGNHNVYISELSSGKHVKTLSGHPRTPWCVAFHPSHTQVLASGCLGGQVRVWDLSGGSEVWTVNTDSVASITFHPRDHLLVIAASNELHFWDWRKPRPFKCIKTNSIKAKVRFVAFDALGHKLITGITCWPQNQSSGSITSPSVSCIPPENAPSHIPGSSTHEQIVTSYHHLVQRYDSLVRNYHHLIMARSHLSNMIDRGTDPMEADWPSTSSSSRNVERNSNLNQPTNLIPGTSDSVEARTTNNHPAQITIRRIHRTSSSEPTTSATSQASNSASVPIDSTASGETRRQTPDTKQSNANKSEPTTSATSQASNSASVPIDSTASVETRRQTPDTRQSNANKSEPTTSATSQASNSASVPIDSTASGETRRQTPDTRQSNANKSEPTTSATSQASNSASVPIDSTASGETRRQTPDTRQSNANTAVPGPSQNSTSSATTPPMSLSQAFSSSQSIRNELTASLNRLQGFMENSIDRTLNLWDRYDSTSSSTRRTSSNPSRDFTSRSLCRRNYVNYLRTLAENAEPNPPSDSTNNQVPRLDRIRHNLHALRDLRLRDEIDEHVSPIPPHLEPRIATRGPEIIGTEFTLRTPQPTILQYEPSEPSNVNSETRSLNAIHNMLRNSGNRLLNLLRNYGVRGQSRASLDADRDRDSSSERTDDRHSLSDAEYMINHGFDILPNIATALNDNLDESVLGDTTRNPSNSESDTSSNEISMRNSNQSTSSDNVFQSPTPAAPENSSDTRVSGNTSADGSTPSTSSIAASIIGTINRSHDAFNRVTLGVELIQRHAETLVSLWSRVLSTSAHPSLSRVRLMWEDLRREIMLLQTPSSEEQPSTFTRSTLNRCQMLNEMLSRRYTGPQPGRSNQSRRSRHHPYDRADPSTKRCPGATRTKSSSNSQTSGNPSQGTSTENGASTSSTNIPEATPSVSNTDRRSHERAFSIWRRLNRSARRSSIPLSTRSQEIRHRRNVNICRRGELEITRDRIRMRARRILAIMFSIMMDCLNAGHLGDRIITMLKYLKKALTVTCLLLMTHLFSLESRRSSASSNRQENNESSPNVEQSRVPTNEEYSNFIRISSFPEDTEHFRGVPDPFAVRRLLQLRRMSLNPGAFNLRRSIPSRNLQPFLTESTRAPEPNFEAGTMPSTSGLQPNSNTTESGTQSSEASINALLSNCNCPNESSLRSRLSQDPRLRSHLPCFYRRLLLNQGLMSNMLQILRRRCENLDIVPSPEENSSAYRLSRARRFVTRNVDSNSEEGNNPSHINVSVPVVQVNDIPIEITENQTQRYATFNEFLQPIMAQNAFQEESENRLTTTIRFAAESPPLQVYRIQAWDFTRGDLPDISDVNKNVVVRECRIHNDANIDISADGRMLVAILPAHRMAHATPTLGIFSLDWNNLGECLYKTFLEQNAVSVSLSPCARHLAVGLGSRRISLLPYGQNGTMAIIFRLESIKAKGNETTSLKILKPIRTLEHNFQDSGFTTLNCLRWAPQPGQGLVYANSIGQLKILS
ncbi:uncharacterized protein LOC143918181 [Arctopsyche grandis]|uniref:uncharacterized protein LOC143918181 n=1 Tax=Arctopsyche grandis TaxID=121162 RepID=UPI00406D7861